MSFVGCEMTDSQQDKTGLALNHPIANKQKSNNCVIGNNREIHLLLDFAAFTLQE